MSERILIVGDIHGDWGSLNKLINTKKPTLVLQAGDFGWWPKMEVKQATIYTHEKPWYLEGVKSQGAIVRWCDGNHEDHESLDSMGRAQKNEVHCYEGVIYQPRGSTYTLDDGRVVLFAGGGDSIDKSRRTPGFDWFSREIPSDTEHDRMLSHDHVDIVISHTAPTAWIPDVCRGDKFPDPTRLVLQDVLEKYRPALWYHGHWHNEASGTVSRDNKTTRWFSLDYPGHHGRWWMFLPQI